MKRVLACIGLFAAFAALSGCYYDPGYSYVRSSSYSGDAYYGDQGNVYYAQPVYPGGYSDGYYGSGYYGGGYYGGYSPGVSIGISSGWYGRGRYYDRRGGRDYRDDHRRRHDDHGGRDHRRGDRHDRGAYRSRPSVVSPAVRPPSSSQGGRVPSSQGRQRQESPRVLDRRRGGDRDRRH